MSPRSSKKDLSAKHLLRTLKQSLSLDALNSLHTKRHGNAGRERYRRAGLMASASFIFARWWGVAGAAFDMALCKFCTSSPIQLFKIRGILRANRAPVLVVEELSLA